MAGKCSMHYQRWRKFGDVREDIPPRPRVRRKRHHEPPPLCAVDGCAEPNFSRGWCTRHYARWKRNGDPTIDRSIRRGVCEVEGCERTWLCKRMCQLHYRRWVKHGDPLYDHSAAPALTRSALDWCNLSDVGKITWTRDRLGYRKGYWPEHPNATSGTRQIAEHTAVMAATLGRPIRDGETVHHRNGVRYDNRPENLELWASHHKPGQRVTDLIAFAHEILERYADDMQLWPEHLRP